MNTNNKQINILDHGHVRLVDSMGDDSSIVQAARVSHGAGTKTEEEDKQLINYLFKNRHTTPFEMVEFKFHCKMPIFVARQWVRHRTASINEVSARYTQLPNEFYIPENLRGQDSKNKQVADGDLIDQIDNMSRENIRNHCEVAYNLYEELLGDGVGRELARMVLPINIYTEWYWKIDLHNLFHFLGLRMDKHAQYEIRVFADAMFDIIKEIVPVACQAFVLHGR